MKYLPVNWELFGSTSKNAASRRLLLYLHMRQISKWDGEIEYVDVNDIDIDMFVDNFLWTKRYLNDTFAWLANSSLFDFTSNEDILDVNLNFSGKGVYISEKSLKKLIDLNFYREIADLQQVYNITDHSYSEGAADARAAQIVLELMYECSQKGKDIQVSISDFMTELGYDADNSTLYHNINCYFDILKEIGIFDWEECAYKKKMTLDYDRRYKRKLIKINSLPL